MKLSCKEGKICCPKQDSLLYYNLKKLIFNISYNKVLIESVDTHINGTKILIQCHISAPSKKLVVLHVQLDLETANSTFMVFKLIITN